MKKKLSPLTLAKLIYSGEFLLFGIIFVVIGALLVAGIIPVLDWKKWAFTIVTSVGFIYNLVDFILILKNPKRREKNPLIDKLITLPIAFVVFGLDIFALINLIKDPEWYLIGEVNFFQYFIGITLLLYSLTFIFNAIYHWFHIHPSVIDALEEDEKKELENKENKDHE